jgi:hypothetical protein
MRPEAITAKVGFQAITLRPSLRAAATLESRYGFQKLFDAVGDGNLTVIADVIEASSDCDDFLKAIDGIPLIKVLPNVLKKTTKHILALAGADEGHAGVRKAVGIRRGAISGNMKVSFQAARSIG